MEISKITVGNDPPNNINVIIEISAGGGPVKYEIDKISGSLNVDRLLSTAMHYPGNYGFIPHTLSDDGDPVDVIICNTVAIIPGAVVSCRPVGVLKMKDEAGMDEKILAVPSNKLTKLCDHIKDLSDMPTAIIEEIQHFFEHYKDLEYGKTVTILGWEGVEEAKNIINSALERYSTQ